MSPHETHCLTCGKPLSAEFRFCGYCGQPRDTADASNEPIFYSVGLAERRQLTVLFCDLCGSMLITQLLDQEDMRELIKRYQNLSQQICEKYGGYISRYIGDGIVVFFGFPNPLEDAAERAIAAGLEMVSTLQELQLHRKFGLREPVMLRVGIATGEVVIGDEIGEGASRQHIAVGLAPNLAARIQEFADPGVVMISDETHAVVGRSFDCIDRGMQSFKNVLEPVRCWQVGQRNESLNRFDSRSRIEESRFFGRASELEFLYQAWEDMKMGNGRSIVVSGAPGIGKSRLVRELLQRITDPHQFLVFQCVASRQNTALHPFIHFSEEYISESAYGDRMTAARSATGQLSSLHANRQVLSAGFDITRDELVDDPATEVFSRLVKKISQVPSIVVIEDIQWSDPTSLAVINKLGVNEIPVLLLVTSRAEILTQAEYLSGCDQLHLNELREEEKMQLVDSLVGNVEFPTRLKQEIMDRSDGTPLFLEELAKAALAQKEMTLSDSNSTGSIVIPLDIKDALFTQLGSDQLTRAVVQYASVIGAEFTKENLLQILPDYVRDIDERLMSLVTQGVLHGADQQGRFGFKHALLRETAYGSLLKQDRQLAHLALAKAYTDDSVTLEDIDLEILARHFTYGGANREAIEYWIKAAQYAARISANQEAVSHYERGLQLLKSSELMRSVPDLELKLQLGLASSLVFTKGPGSMEVRSAYSRAMDLCKLSKPNELHFAAYWGWWKISYDYAIHKERADDILKLSQKLNKSELVMQAHHCQWATQFYLGHIQSCCDHIRDGLAEYDSENHLAEASLYGGHDAKVCALGELALSEWLLGKMDTSVSSMAKSMSWAKQSGHTGSIAHALDICLMLRVYADEYEAMKVEAEELISFAEKHKSPDHLAKGYIYHGWATANLGNERSGFTNFMRGIDLQREIGTREDFAVFDCMRTYFHRINKEYSAAIELLNNTLDEANHKSIVNWNSEIIRYRASLMSFSDSSTRVEIFDEFEKARKVAEKFGMNSLQLKVLNSAVEYSLATGSVSKDLSVRFNNLLSGFTEGFNTKLLKSSLNLQRQIS